MKRTLLVFVVFLAANVCQADEIQLPHITVYGTAVTDVVPDQMVWSVQVRIERQDLEQAASELAKSVGEVLSLLKKLKVENKDVQTSRMEFGGNKEYRSSSWVKTGYYAETDVSFKLTDFSRYKELWIGLTKIIGVSVESVSYDDGKRIEHRKETRRKALEAAREKAVEMAKVLGSQIQEPLLVEEDLYNDQTSVRNTNIQIVNSVQAAENPNVREDGQLALGTIPIQVRIKVSFRLLTAQK